MNRRCAGCLLTALLVCALPAAAGAEDASVLAPAETATETVRPELQPAPDGPPTAPPLPKELAFVPEPGDPEPARAPRLYSLELDLINLFWYRNDADFDRSDPLYDAYGQSVGYLGTFVQPRFGIAIPGGLRFYYESEIGLDLWSHNNPDAGLGSAEGLSYKHRELWGEARWQRLGLKAGYQRLTDPSGLFLNHWIGAVRLSLYGGGSDRISLFAGQLPDRIGEGGWDFSANNFASDLFVGGIDGSILLLPGLSLEAGGYFLWDGHEAGRDRIVGAVSALLAARFDSWSASLAAVGQAGHRQKGAADGSGSLLSGWAVSLSGEVRPHEIVRILGSFSVLSPDDGDIGNDDGSFAWSGKRPGGSILLSENETRDRGDNIDEKLSVFDGWFYATRAGLIGLDLSLLVDPLDWLTVGLTGAGLLTVEPDNALGGRLAGIETDLFSEFRFFDRLLALRTTVGLLIPGRAAAAYNRIDPTATDLNWYVEAAVIMHF